MALRPDRWIIEEDITQACHTVTNRGVILCYSTSNSGVAVGGPGNVEAFASPSGKTPAGMLLDDCVSVDETQYHRNFHKDQIVLDEKCCLVKKGRLVTNMIFGTPAVGGTAYLHGTGFISTSVHGGGGTVATPKIGQFASIKDELGYVAIDIMLPQL